MPIASFLLLKQLIVGLTQSEKRHMVVYSKRMTSSNAAVYMKLFHLIEKNPELTEDQVRNKLRIESKQSFLNTKRHLYGQILKSIRIKEEDKNPEMILRQKLNIATILYERGELEACNRILHNTEDHFYKLNRSNVALELLELQKKIESRHITRSRKQGDRVEWLINNSKSLSQNVFLESQMLNVSLQVHGLYIKWGFVQSEKDLHVYETYFNSILPPYPLNEMSSHALVLWYQAHVWYHYMRLEFKEALKSGMRWLEVMEGREGLVKQDPALYLRGLHYVLTLCYYLEDHQKFELHFRKMIKFTSENENSTNPSTSLLSLIYTTNANINNRLLRRRMHKLDEFVADTMEAYEKHSGSMDNHRHIMLSYKVAMMYIYKGDYEKALDYVNKILEVKDEPLRKDILCYARLLQLYCHYCMENYDLVGNLINNVRTTFESSGCYNKVIEVMLQFLKLGGRAMNFGISDLVDDTLKGLSELRLSRFDRVAFLYFDHFRWVKSLGMDTNIEKLPS